MIFGYLDAPGKLESRFPRTPDPLGTTSLAPASVHEGLRCATQWFGQSKKAGSGLSWSGWKVPVRPKDTLRDPRSPA